MVILVVTILAQMDKTPGRHSVGTSRMTQSTVKGPVSSFEDHFISTLHKAR